MGKKVITVYHGEDLNIDDQIPFYLSMKEVQDRVSSWDHYLWLRSILVPAKDKSKINTYKVDWKRKVFLLAWNGNDKHPEYEIPKCIIEHVPTIPIRTFRNKNTDYSSMKVGIIHPMCPI